MIRDALSRLAGWIPIVIYGFLFVVVLYACVAGSASSGGQVCSETGTADQVDYDC